MPTTEPADTIAPRPIRTPGRTIAPSPIQAPSPTTIDGSALVLSSSFGIEPGPIQRIEIGEGIIGECALSQQIYIESASLASPRSPLEANLTACVPLIVEGVVTGAIAIFRLLDHKPKLEPIDHELFALLGTHAAMALHYTTLVERLGGRRSLPPARLR